MDKYRNLNQSSSEYSVKPAKQQILRQWQGKHLPLGEILTSPQDTNPNEKVLDLPEVTDFDWDIQADNVELKEYFSNREKFQGKLKLKVSEIILNHD